MSNQRNHLRRRNGIWAAAASLALLATTGACSIADTIPGLPHGTAGGTAEETIEETVVETTEADEPTDVATDGITCTWWHNATVDPLRTFWSDVAAEFEADHPGVHVNVQSFQNEELRRTILPNALAGGNAPDVFQSWGGGELVDWVRHDYVKDISNALGSQILAIGPTVEGWQVDGRTYGLPYTFGPSGFWYNKDVLERAGIDLAEFTPPATLDDLYRLWDRLKEAGEVPVALGGGDTWPAAHWWYWTALRSVPTDQIALATTEHNFDDPNWEQAGLYLDKIVDHEPFNEDWETTSAQQFAGSSAGQVVNGEAAMELMGAWAPSTMLGIWNDQTGQERTSPPDWLGWFPFPSIPTGKGDQAAILGGGDGFSVSASAPSQCVQLLGYILSPDVQQRYAELGNLPVLQAAMNEVTFQPLREAADALHQADHVQLWFDVAFGQEVGLPLNSQIAAYMRGSGKAQDIVDAMREAAGTMPVSETDEAPTE